MDSSDERMPDKPVSHETPELDPDKVDTVLANNGYAHIRGQALAAVNAAASMPLASIDAALAYLERHRGGNGREPLAAQVSDGMDLDRWNLEALRDFVVALDAVGKRAAARQELRR